MSDPLRGIKPTAPAYPMRPVKPATKDRESGERKERLPPDTDADPDEDEHKPTIDEYV
ncbi:MAG: hypothetical protein ACREQ8_15000 [Woeseiaceae bacterium]